jgi:hypothetical protein
MVIGEGIVVSVSDRVDHQRGTAGKHQIGIKGSRMIGRNACSRPRWQE